MDGTQDDELFDDLVENRDQSEDVSTCAKVSDCDRHCYFHINRSTAKAEQTYFAIRGGKAKRVDAASVVQAASVCGGKSHFAAKLRVCPLRHAAIRHMMRSRCAS
ncbi:hypothetical protein DPMN_019676 [Dreissena polymorpha]|uniref:Uncharacterized protein n=1 Tax=Dreissena polymorpha TaxID=45954 RepID=A0A9D4NJQ7_DREPO|nr:hypothetical protein DPMN_019676 [Dreissena polymorpha]